MTDDKLEIVREIYARWLDGRSPRELIADDVEYVNPPDAVEGGTRRGRAAFRGHGERRNRQLRAKERTTASISPPGPGRCSRRPGLY